MKQVLWGSSWGGLCAPRPRRESGADPPVRCVFPIDRRCGLDRVCESTFGSGCRRRALVFPRGARHGPRNDAAQRRQQGTRSTVSTMSARSASTALARRLRECQLFDDSMCRSEVQLPFSGAAHGSTSRLRLSCELAISGTRRTSASRCTDDSTTGRSAMTPGFSGTTAKVRGSTSIPAPGRPWRRVLPAVPCGSRRQPAHRARWRSRSPSPRARCPTGSTRSAAAPYFEQFFAPFMSTAGESSSVRRRLAAGPFSLKAEFIACR